MTKEAQIVTEIVTKLIHNGAIDELVAAVIESSLESNLEELEKLSNKPYLQPHHWQDYADCLVSGRAFIATLRYFTVNDYLEEEFALNKYSEKLGVF
jgi:hypothetical protein